MLSEKLNISGNTIIDNNEEIIAVDNSVDITDNEKVITNITTTTVPSLQDSYEEEMKQISTFNYLIVTVLIFIHQKSQFIQLKNKRF